MIINARSAVVVWALLSSLLNVVWAQAVAATEDEGRAAAAAHRKAEHERIHHEREALAAARHREEAACYQRFAVEDCLRGVRAKAREAEDRLRAREVDLNDAERKGKAAERLRSIEEKQKAVPAVLPSDKGPDAVVRKPSYVDPLASKAQRDRDAEQRAQQQRSRAQVQASEQAARAAGNADRAIKARARHEESLKAAEERRARVEKSQADAAAQGHKSAAPLPSPSAPVFPR